MAQVHGPDYNTRPARFRPPPGACDVHAHVYGPTSRFPYPGGWSPRAQRPDAIFEDYMRMHEVLGIERGVLVQSYRYDTDNSALLDALERGQPYLRGIVAMHPSDLTDATIADLEGRGVRGIRVHDSELADIELVSERIADVGWRIEYVPSSIEELISLRPRFEKLRCGILVDQLGVPDPELGVDHPHFQAVLSMVRDGLIWMKLSHSYNVSKAGPPYDDVLPFAQAYVAANAGRCLWGTDWPHNTKWETPNDGFLLDLLADWVPDEATRNRILVDNPQTLNRF